MSNKRIEVWAWVCVYSGLLLLSLSLFVGRADAALAWWLGVPGALLVVAGAALVVLRSRMPETKE